MGCIVNGPGESKHANIGISLPGTGEEPAAPVFIDGEKKMTLRGPESPTSSAIWLRIMLKNATSRSPRALWMFIQTHPLDDPALMQFTPGEPVLPVGNAPIDEAEASEISPLARRLLRIDGIEGVALSLDHVTLRRADGNEWYILKPAVLGAIMEHYGSGEPVPRRCCDGKNLDLLDDRIRPAIEAYWRRSSIQEIR